MGEAFSSKPSFNATVPRPWPAWAPLREAAQYARMSSDKLMSLVRQGEVTGYANPDFRRGPKGEGEWWVHLPSIDGYHARKSGSGAVEKALLATKNRLGL